MVGKRSKVVEDVYKDCNKELKTLGWIIRMRS